jgi:hypothetical protein
MKTLSPSVLASVPVMSYEGGRICPLEGTHERTSFTQLVRPSVHVLPAVIFTFFVVLAATASLAAEAGPNVLAANNSQRALPKADSKGLLKPAIPPDAPQAVESNKPAIPGVQKPPPQVQQRMRLSRRAQEARWEDSKVKNAAKEIATGLPSVKKIQVCYAVDSDEWWVSLYDDVGTDIDIRQFIWNREQETLEPFLVLNRIPKTRLNAHISRKTRDRACETLEPGSPTR